MGGDNRWTDDDRDKVFAYKIRENKRCPKCHQLTDDWQDPETHRPIVPPPLEVTEWYCEPCAQFERAVERKREGPGVSVRFRTPTPEPMVEPTL